MPHSERQRYFGGGGGAGGAGGNKGLGVSELGVPS